MHDMQIRNPVVCDASKVSLYKTLTTSSQLDRSSRKIILVILNSPVNYHNHRPSQNNPKNNLSYSQLITQAYRAVIYGLKILA